MNIKALEQEMRAQADIEIRAVATAAEEQVQRSLAQAEEEAQSIHLAICDEIASQSTSARERALSQARREALTLVGEAQARCLDSIMAMAQDRLCQVRQWPLYPQLLRKLVWEAVERFRDSVGENETMCLIADARDKEILTHLLAEAEVPTSVHYELSSWGGVVAASADRRVKVTNTLEARLECVAPFIRGHLITQIAVEADRYQLAAEGSR